MTPAQTLQHRTDGPDNAPVLVLGPALGTTWHMWDRQIPELTRNWRVLRFDLPGHGGSPAYSADSADAYAERLLATLDRLGIERSATRAAPSAAPSASSSRCGPRSASPRSR